MKQLLRKCKQSICNEEGFSYIQACVWVLVLSMLFTLVLSYATTMVLVQTAQDNTQRVLDTYVTNNSRIIFDALKNHRDTTTSLNQGFFIAALKDELALEYTGGVMYYKTLSGETLYRTTNPRISFEIANRLKLQATYNIIFPITFAGEQLGTLQLPQKVVAYYNLK